MAVQSSDLHHHRLCKLSTCEASQQNTGASVAGSGLALAAVGFVGAATHTLRQSQGLGYFPSSHSGSRCVTAVSWYLTSVDLCLQICTGGFVNTVPEGHQALLLAFPWRGRAEGSANNSVLCEPAH